VKERVGALERALPREAVNVEEPLTSTDVRGSTFMTNASLTTRIQNSTRFMVMFF
jgi:hypothetical protein